MRHFTFLAIVLLSLPSAAIAEGTKDIVWTSTRLTAAPAPADTEPPPGLSISSDEGQIEYEALEPEAEKPQQPEPIPAARMQGRKPMIAIVIDDMGMDRRHTARALKLPPQVALSYLPYSPDIRLQTNDAFAAGHELILHLPMQPERKTANPGPDFLGADMPPLELLERVNKNLSAFHGYVGVNNHMGSRFTKNRDGLNVVMSAIAEKNLMFLDSRTVPGSLAEKVAKEHGIQATHRDVFLDDDTSAKTVAKALIEIEAVARHSGTAIAIGHPKDVTLAALEKWLPTLKAKGFELVPLTQVIALRNVPKTETPTGGTLSALGALPSADAAVEKKAVVKVASAPAAATPIMAEATEPIVVAVPDVVAVPAPASVKAEVLAVQAPALPAKPAPVEFPAPPARPKKMTLQQVPETKPLQITAQKIQITAQPLQITVQPLQIAAQPPDQKIYIDSVAKAEAKAKEWQSRQQ